MTGRVWCENWTTRTLSSQGLHHDTLLWLINVASVYRLLTAEGSLMGIGDLTSGEDCCLRQRKEKVIELRCLFVMFSCLPCTHGLRSRSSRIVHSFLNYPYSNVLGQKTENYYSTKFTTGTPLAATSHYRVLQHTTATLGRTSSRRSRPCCSSFPTPIHLYRALPLRRKPELSRNPRKSC